MTKHLLYTKPWISLCVSPPNTVIRIVSCVWIVYVDLTTISQQVIFCTGEHHKVTSYRVRNLPWINDSYRNQFSHCWPHYRSILICGRYPIFIKELNEQAPCLQDLPVRQDVPTDGADHAEVADAATTKVTAPKKKAHWAVPEPNGVSTSNGRVSWENLGE